MEFNRAYGMRLEEFNEGKAIVKSLREMEQEEWKAGQCKQKRK